MAGGRTAKQSHHGAVIDLQAHGPGSMPRGHRNFAINQPASMTWATAAPARTWTRVPYLGSHPQRARATDCVTRRGLCDRSCVSRSRWCDGQMVLQPSSVVRLAVRAAAGLGRDDARRLATNPSGGGTGPRGRAPAARALAGRRRGRTARRLVARRRCSSAGARAAQRPQQHGTTRGARDYVCSGLHSARGIHAKRSFALRERAARGERSARAHRRRWRCAPRGRAVAAATPRRAREGDLVVPACLKNDAGSLLGGLASLPHPARGADGLHQCAMRKGDRP